MNAEIIKVSESKYALMINGELYSEYTRKSSAQRRLNSLIQERELKVEDSSTALAVAGAAQATLDTANAVLLPPTSNTGGQKNRGHVQHQGLKAEVAKPYEFKQPEKFNKYQANLNNPISEVMTHYVMINGEIKTVPLRMGKGTAAHIDTLTLTFAKSALFVAEQYEQLHSEDEEDELMLANIEPVLVEIFGFGFSSRGNGRNGYAKTANMGTKTDDRIKYGFFGWGNGDKQGNTVCLHISGIGVTAALDGWENRLYAWIKANAPYAKITRIDLAHDFLNGEYTPIQAYIDWQNGLYRSHSTNPVAEMVGKGWLNDPFSGRTLYIGSRQNGSRVLRVYEKGIEQGDKNSLWVRVELQMRNRDIVIEHEILLNPGEYLTGAYPIFQELFAHYDQDAKKCERIQKMKEISLEHCVYHLSIQGSPTIKALRYLGFDSAEITEIIENAGAKMPKRLHPNAFDANSFAFVDFIVRNRRSPNNEVELYNYAVEKFLQQDEQQRKAKIATPEQQAEFERNFKLQTYLKAVFARDGYQACLDAGLTHDDYIHARYGSIKPSQSTYFNQPNKEKHHESTIT